ncbi:MAG: spore maturation protein SpmA [Myxococcota bacterium]
MTLPKNGYNSRGLIFNGLLGGSNNSVRLSKGIGENRVRQSPGLSRAPLDWGVLVLNWVWLGLILTSIVYGAFTGNIGDVSKAISDGAKSAFELVIGLVGGMVFMLGIMRVAFDGGLRDIIAKALAPLLRRLFPDIPADHPAMAAMVMNMACNLMGLGNAATPFGIKAMSELAKINRHPGSASNAMVLFLAINTSSINLFPPTGTIFVRAAAGSADPFAIWLPTLFATICSTLGAVGFYFLLRKLPMFKHEPLSDAELALLDAQEDSGFDSDDVEIPPSREYAPMGARRAIVVYGVCIATLTGMAFNANDMLNEKSAADVFFTLANAWSFPLLIGGLLLFGFARGVRVYESMVEGAKEGLSVSARIVPYLVAILTAVAMFRASGALDSLIGLINPITKPLGVPAEVLPMALLRPFSGTGAFGIMSETLTAHGPDTFIGFLTSTLQGSTETTFYVLAVYFGAARISQGRHTLPACLAGDFAGFVGAVVACHLFFN